MSGRKEKQLLRPRKSPSEKLRRFKVHQRRLMALGLSEEQVRKLNFKQARDLLKRPGLLRRQK